MEMQMKEMEGFVNSFMKPMDEGESIFDGFFGQDEEDKAEQESRQSKYSFYFISKLIYILQYGVYCANVQKRSYLYLIATYMTCA